MNAKLKYLEIQRKALLAELQKLNSRISNPELTQEQLDTVKSQLAECQKKFQALGFASKKDVSDA